VLFGIYLSLEFLYPIAPFTYNLFRLHYDLIKQGRKAILDNFVVCVFAFMHVHDLYIVIKMRNLGHLWQRQLKGSMQKPYTD